MKNRFACFLAVSAFCISTSLYPQINDSRIQFSLLNGLNSFTNNSSKDSVYFLKNGINLGLQGNYYWKSLGIAGRVGYVSNAVNQTKVADFGLSRRADPDNMFIIDKPFKGFYWMAGPSFQTTFNRWQVESTLLGGLLHHDESGVFIGDRSSQDIVYYQNQLDAGSAFSFNAGLGIGYSISAPLRIGISADYLLTQNDVTNNDIYRGGGTEAQQITGQANFLSAALKVTYTPGSNRQDRKQVKTTKAESNNKAFAAKRNTNPNAQQKDTGCDCENKVMDVAFLEPFKVDITFNTLEEAQGFLKSRNNPLYQDNNNSAENPLYKTRETGSGMATGRRQHKPVTAGYDENSNTFELNGNYYIAYRDAPSGRPTGMRQRSSTQTTNNDLAAEAKGMMVTTETGKKVFALFPEAINLHTVSAMEEGIVSVHVKNSPQTKAQDHNSSRSNKSSSIATDNGTGNGEDNNKGKARDYNSSRSNNSSAKATDNGAGNDGKAKAQDHNSSRSNKSSSIAAGNGTGNDDNDGKTKAQDYNSSRSNNSSVIATDTIGDNTNENSHRRDAASGLATGKRQHRPVKVQWDESNDMIIAGDDYFVNIRVRETGSGMATGKRQHQPVTALFDESSNTFELNGQYYTLTHSTRDAASGLPTGRRQHKPMTVMYDEELDAIDIYGTTYHEVKSVRETGSGMATGRRQHHRAADGNTGPVRWMAPESMQNRNAAIGEGAFGVVYKISRVQPVRCSNGRCEIKGVIEMNGAEYEITLSAIIKSKHDTAKNAIQNIK